MAKAADEELRKAFAELHEKVFETRQKIKLLDLQIDLLHRSKQRAELTQIEMRALSGNTKTFESVGRMFLCEDKDTIKTNLKNHMKQADEKIKNFENKKVYLQLKLKDSENNIREMIQRRQQEAN